MTEDANRKIAKIWYSINTANPKSAVELIWDGTPNATMVILGGQSHWDLRTAGNEIVNNATTPLVMYYYLLKILLSDNYTIVAEFR